LLLSFPFSFHTFLPPVWYGVRSIFFYLQPVFFPFLSFFLSFSCSSHDL
jgi:hypothetical protein